jgi:hypothetical protein
MIVHLLAIAAMSYATGVLTALCIRDTVTPEQAARVAWRRFVLLMVAAGTVAAISGAMMRVNMEKTKARIDEVKKLETTLKEAK